ncbi:MAG TPA: family 20 glycosylhydrolase, partial [Pyrinomonadaceae bacterium]
MKRFAAVITLFVLFASVHFAQSDEINIIPWPARIEQRNGHFVLNKSTRIVAAKREDRKIAAVLRDLLKKETGIEFKIGGKPEKAGNNIFVSTSDDVLSETAEYSIDVTPERIEIYSIYGDPGLFYGFQSLIQMLHREEGSAFLVPAAKVSDNARFKYRGMHLDIARHFQPVEFVKRYIDLMSQYKFNYFHWHLTEDQGWRIEIKKYPRLTEIGSKRPETVKERNLTPYIGDGIPHGGFYTQEQIKDVVKYARERQIT